MPRRLLLLLLAIIISGGTVYLAQHWMHNQLSARQSGEPVQVQAHPLVQVLVAKGDIPAGSFLRPESLRWQEWPQNALADSYVVDSKAKLEDYVGAVVRSRLTEGEPITAGRVVHPGDRGFMAAVLTPGNRAVTVNVTASTGMAGFVFPGDRVDLILSMAVHSGNKDDDTRHVSETVLSNIRVLGMDQRIADDKKDVAVPKTATLEVTPKQAEIVAVVSELGLLSLSLRSLATPDETEAPATVSQTWDSEVTHFAAADTTPSLIRKVDVIRGSETSELVMAPPAAKGTNKQ